MRKYKQVKEKKVIYSMPEWEIFENRATTLGIKTGVLIKKLSLEGSVRGCRLDQTMLLTNALRTISNNLRQIAWKANQTNSNHANEIAVIQTELDALAKQFFKFVDSLSKPQVKIPKMQEVANGKKNAKSDS